VNLEQLGFSDIALDSDNVVRRHLLALEPPANSPCSTPYAFNTQVALNYLAKQNINLKFTPEGHWQLGKATIRPLELRSGGYQSADLWGHQVLLNYRSHKSITEIVSTITLGEALAGKLSPDVVKDRIVLIGTTAESFRDFALTPYRLKSGDIQNVPGVLLQAQMISQIVSAALDDRALLWTLPMWGEVLWIWGWSVAGYFTVIASSTFRWALLTGGLIFILYACCLGVLIWLACWIPLVPGTFALLVSSASNRVKLGLFSGNT
jgi:CHASE2 domain-containing sensor protein